MLSRRITLCALLLLVLPQCVGAASTEDGDASATTDGAPNCSGGAVGTCFPKIHVSDAMGAISSGATKVAPGGGANTLELLVTNAGGGPLLIKSIKLDYTAPGPESKPAFACIGGDGVMPCAQVKWPDVVADGVAGASHVKFSVNYTPQTDGIARTARLHIVTNAPAPLTDFVVNFTSVAAP